MTRVHHSTDNSGTPRRSRKAAGQLAKKPSRDFDAAAALGILWVVAMPASAQANTPFAVMVHAHKFAVIARDLVRIGMLRRVRVARELGYHIAAEGRSRHRAGGFRATLSVDAIFD